MTAELIIRPATGEEVIENAAALRAYAFQPSPKPLDTEVMRRRLPYTVDNPFCPWNEGTWRLADDASRLAVEHATPAAPPPRSPRRAWPRWCTARTTPPSSRSAAGATPTPRPAPPSGRCSPPTTPPYPHADF